MDGDYDVAQEKLGRLVQQHGVEVGDCWMANETHTRIYIEREREKKKMNRN